MPLPLSGKPRIDDDDETTKHLIFLFDGTWNSAANGSLEDITNVFRLNRCINGYDESEVPQITFYMPGPGNRGRFDDLLGGIFGQGLDQIIKEAYVNLSCNYWPGDKVYLFGFSRGAVAAHALAALVWKCGLLKADFIDRLSYVWNAFVHSEPSHIAAKVRYVDPNVHPEPKIALLGLFDSVLGRSYQASGKFSELSFNGHTLSGNVRRAVQILSIDDTRKRFRPTLWRKRWPGQVVEQIWMPGVHADIGGVGDWSVLSSISFLTMVSRVQKYTKLSLDEDVIEEAVEVLKSQSRIAISDERKSVEMKALAYQDRQPDHLGIEQYCHPILDVIQGQEILQRGKLRRYSANKIIPFRSLPQSDENRFKDFIPNLNGSLIKTQR